DRKAEARGELVQGRGLRALLELAEEQQRLALTEAEAAVLDRAQLRPAVVREQVAEHRPELGGGLRGLGRELDLGLLGDGPHCLHNHNSCTSASIFRPLCERRHTRFPPTRALTLLSTLPVTP